MNSISDNKIYLILFVMLLTLVLVKPVFANEIQYGHVEEVHDTQLHIQYKGPAGQKNFVCNALTTTCKNFGTSSPKLFPDIEGGSDYVNSPDGKLGIVEEVLKTENGSTTYEHVIYDVSKDVAEEKAVVLYNNKINSYKFPWASDSVVLFGTNREVIRYDVATKRTDTITISQDELPLRSLSPHAKYLSAYNYAEQAHKIWDTTTGKEIVIPSETPAFVEFSQNEKYATFMDDRDDYQTVYISALDNQVNKVSRVFKDNFTVEDYLWFKNDLYVVGNTKDNPYQWVLYRYNPLANKISIVAENISYGDFIRPIGNHSLSFLVIEGKNTHVALYNPKNNEVSVIKPVADAPASNKLTRSIVEFDEGVKGVLYEPKKPDDKPELFVWLHGGPMRQTSFGYHSYLSYAVYDEFLERLSESGAYVLKLDYAGSYGHGKKFKDQLINKLGDIDVKQVTEAARDIQKEYDIDDIYLVGNSYGGYLGPKVLIEDDRTFNGAIAINGVFDWFDLLERIPSSPFKKYFKGLADLDDLEKNFELYKQASVVKELPDLNKYRDLVLVYGEDDATVPTWQTREFFYLAESLGKNVDLLKLEDEGHIIKQRESLNKMCAFVAKELFIKDLKCS